jgi:hypothetical protein
MDCRGPAAGSRSALSLVRLCRSRLLSSTVPSPLSAAIDGLLPVMQRGDLAGFQQIFSRLHRDGEGLPPDELSAAVGELAPVLARRPEGVFAGLALTAGAFVEWGGSALPLAANAPACTLRTMLLRASFSELWPAASGGRPEPGLEQAPSMADLIGVFAGAAGRLGLSERQATSIALAWFDVGHWVNLMITVMARREFRDAAGLLPQIGDAAAGLGESVPRALWLPGLARVLDDEPVVVIDDATGRGFRLTMSGVGDNFQLHTLLADRLIGDPARGLLAGERPAPAWVAAATTAPPRLVAGDIIQRRFRLFDATGAYIYPEGRPADIPLVEGARVIVLHPPCGNYGWAGGRTYEHLIPALTLEHVMTPDQAVPWRARIAPARETDLFGKTSQT